MEIVIPFRPRGTAAPKSPAFVDETAPGSPEHALLAVARTGADHAAVVAAARPLIAHCRDRYGFTVMERGLPRNPTALVVALLALLEGLRMLEPLRDGKRPIPGFGVYFGCETLEWFEDGYGGCTGLALPDDVDPRELADFVQPRLGRKAR